MWTAVAWSSTSRNSVAEDRNSAEEAHWLYVGVEKGYTKGREPRKVEESVGEEEWSVVVVVVVASDASVRDGSSMAMPLPPRSELESGSLEKEADITHDLVVAPIKGSKKCKHHHLLSQID